jgi:signal transduction histidine kinase
MNPYNFALLFFAFSAFLIGLFVLLKRQDVVGRTYFVFSIVVTIWGVGHSLSISQNISYDLALRFDQFTHIGAVFIPVSWFHLTLVLSGNIQKYKKSLRRIYWVAALTSLSVLTPWFIADEIPALGFPHFTKPGPLYHIYVGMFLVLVPLGFVELWKLIKRVKSDEKIEMKGLFIATLFGFVGGSFAFLPVYGLMIPQYGYFIMPFYPFFMAYFMIRHRLFDVEQAVQAFQREKLATIGLIASSINHEIRNPLYIAKTAVESFLENEKEGIAQKKTSAQISETVLAQLNRALDVITKLNRFAKPTNEQSAERIEHSASIPEAINTVLDLISYEFELEKIHIKNEIPTDFPVAQCDPRQLEEILFNLIVNACHAMSGGGILTLSAKLIAGGKIEMQVADTGTGVSPDRMKHLFEPFHTTKGEKGTGLGLYITKQLIELNGGRITVKSEEKKGTNFNLEFKVI